MSAMCPNHDFMIREGEVECPTCKEIRYPRQEMDELKASMSDMNETNWELAAEIGRLVAEIGRLKEDQK